MKKLTALLGLSFALLFPGLSSAANHLNSQGFLVNDSTGALVMAAYGFTTGTPHFDNRGLLVDDTGALVVTLSGAIGSAGFDALTSATNTTATMHVGTGASLDATGSGTITATAAPLSGITGLGTGVGTLLGGASSGTGGPAGTASPTFTGTVGASALTQTGIYTNSTAGALSASPFVMSGAPITGGSGTTTFPLMYFNTTGAGTVSSFNTSGVFMAFNGPSGFSGNFLETHANGGGVLVSISAGGTLSAGTLTTTGNVNAGASSTLTFTGRSKAQSPSDGVFQISNNAATSLTRLDLGLNTSSGPAFCVSSTTTTHCLGDGTAGGTFAAANYKLTNLMSSTTAPTISSGFGSSPSIAANNGTAAFTINVGTGGTANSGVIGLPTATTGWAVHCDDVTTQSSSVFVTKQTATSTTTATITQYNTSAAATAWGASDVLVCMATAY